MTASYIPWNDGRLRPLLHGLVANIPAWPFFQRHYHGHACTSCAHAHVCLCLGTPREKRRELLRCPWCTPWVMEWAPLKAKPREKRARRRATRRPLQPVP